MYCFNEIKCQLEIITLLSLEQILTSMMVMLAMLNKKGKTDVTTVNIQNDTSSQKRWFKVSFISNTFLLSCFFSVNNIIIIGKTVKNIQVQINKNNVQTIKVNLLWPVNPVH